MLTSDIFGAYTCIGSQQKGDKSAIYDQWRFIASLNYSWNNNPAHMRKDQQFLEPDYMKQNLTFLHAAAAI